MPQFVSSTAIQKEVQDQRTSFFSSKSILTLGGASFAIYLIGNFTIIAFAGIDKRENEIIEWLKLTPKSLALTVATLIALGISIGRHYVDQQTQKLRMKRLVQKYQDAGARLGELKIIKAEGDPDILAQVAVIQEIIDEIEDREYDLFEVTQVGEIDIEGRKPETPSKRIKLITTTFNLTLIIANTVLIVVTAAGLSSLEGTPWFTDKNAAREQKELKKQYDAAQLEQSNAAVQEDLSTLAADSGKVQLTNYHKALQFEKEGFEFIISGQFNYASVRFDSCEKVYPGFHQAFELKRYLLRVNADKSLTQDEDHISRIQCEITQKFGWKAPAEQISLLKEKCSD